MPYALAAVGMPRRWAERWRRWLRGPAASAACRGRPPGASWPSGGSARRSGGGPGRGETAGGSRRRTTG